MKRCARNVRRFILKIHRMTNNSSYEERNSSYDETVRKMSFLHCSFLRLKLLSAQLYEFDLLWAILVLTLGFSMFSLHEVS